MVLHPGCSLVGCSIDFSSEESGVRKLDYVFVTIAVLIALFLGARLVLRHYFPPDTQR
jgi:hypothetical protein